VVKQDSRSRFPSVWVVIPAFNESAAVLQSTILGLVLLDCNIVVVDDGSTSPAEPQLSGLPVHIIRHFTNLGQGAALQTGVDYALKLGGQIIVHFDADGQHDPAAIPELIAPIESGICDVALGSRFIRREDRVLVPLQKRLLLKAGVVISYAFTGVWLTDTHNCFRALSRRAAQKIRLNENGYAHATEILEQIRRHCLKYKEVACPIRYTNYSMNKGQSAFNSINIVVDIIMRKLFS